MNKNLQRAIDSLHINDVYLRESIAKCFDGFDPKYNDGIEELEIQTKYVVKQSQVVTVEGDGLLLRVFIEFGVRWVVAESEGDDKPVRAMIEAEFIAEYLMDSLIEEVCTQEFSLKNASYHVWPYWREFLMNQCGRMHLPRLIVPAIQLAHNRH